MLERIIGVNLCLFYANRPGQTHKRGEMVPPSLILIPGVIVSRQNILSSGSSINSTSLSSFAHS